MSMERQTAINCEGNVSKVHIHIGNIDIHLSIKIFKPLVWLGRNNLILIA